MFAWGTASLPMVKEAQTRMPNCPQVSTAFFHALGVVPATGRLLYSSDDQPWNSAGCVVISYGFWQREFAGEPSAIGKPLVLGERVFEIVGVTPPSFFGLEVGKQYDVAMP